MIEEQANQIAKLLNKRNQLIKDYSTNDVLGKKENYVFLNKGSKIIACAESKKVQWYQWEISHVSVDKDYEGQGFGSRILKMAEQKAIDGGCENFSMHDKIK